MAYDELLTDKVRQALSGVQFTEKKMFGGISFMVNGKMCVAVNNRPDHIMMVRVDSEDQGALKRKGAKVAIMRGKEMPGWIFLAKEAITTQDDFDYWIQLALAFNKNLERE